MAHAHDLVFFGPGRDYEIWVLERLAFDDQAVISGRLERVAQAAKDTLIVVQDRRHLAVHDAIVTDDLAAERIADALMSQAHAERRNGWSEALEHVVRNPRLLRRARPRRDDDVARLHCRDLVERDLVIAVDAQIDARVHFPEPLHEVVSERIVVVDE